MNININAILAALLAQFLATGETSVDAAVATEAAKIGLNADETAKVTQAVNDLMEVAVSFATRKLVPTPAA